MKKISVEEFWDWFKTKSEFLMDIDNMDPFEADELMKEFESKLSDYSEGMSFEMTDLTKDGRKIIFSAEGDEDFFDDVIQLCENAPILDFWDIVAFKPAKGQFVKIKFENYFLNSKDLLFLPMESDDFDEQIGLTVALKGYNEDDEDQLIAIYSLIEAMIGEYDCTTLLGYFELCELTDNLKNEGYMPLTELPEYIDWHLNNIQNS